MTLIKFNRNQYPASPFGNLFNDFFNGYEGVDFKKSHLPPVNMKETDSIFLLELGVPGVKKDEIKIKIDDDVMTVSSETKEENSEENENFTRKEFSYSSFSRSFTLPEIADSEKVEADYMDGVLKITIPKLVEAKSNLVKEIKIS